MTTSHRAILKFVAQGNKTISINYSRRIYAIVRRYTPEVVEGGRNECFAELTGLRTFFKMSYKELVDKIVYDLSKEIGVKITAAVVNGDLFDYHKNTSKKAKTISTYSEMNSLFAGKKFIEKSKRSTLRGVHTKRRVRLTVPFIGKVA